MINSESLSVKESELGPLKEEFETDEENKWEDFQDILKLAGSQGLYQKILLYAVLGPISAIQALMAMNNIFFLFVPDHWCHVSGLMNDMDIADWKNQTLPTEIGPNGLPRFSQCSMYDSYGNITSCSDGWEYDKTDYENTIPSTFNWVCSKADYATQVFTVGMAGGAVGHIIFGILADKCGRRPIYFISLFVNVFFKFISFFFPHAYIPFLIAHFISSTGMPLMFTSPSMICAEVCDNEFRAWTYSVSWMIWVAGIGALPLIAWVGRRWMLIGMVTTVPGFFLFVAYYKVIPESPRWLLSVGRLDEAKKIIIIIAKRNGNIDNISSEKLDIMLQSVHEHQRKKAKKNEGAWTLFSRRRLAINTTMLAISWSMNTLIYEGITLNTPNMSGNQFLNFFVLSLVEIPATMLGAFLLDRIGRRWTQAAFFLIGAIASFIGAVAILHPSLAILSIGTVIVSKFCVTLTFLVVYLQATELFPTHLRSTGNSVVSTIGSIFGIFGPQVVYAGQFYSGAPYLFLGLFCIIGVISSAILPETLHQNLPETLEDAINFGKNQKFFSIKPKSKTSKEVSGKHDRNSIKT